MTRTITLAIAALAGSAAAQTGTPDQVGPRTNASYNETTPSLTWQQQIRAGAAGRLEGIELTMLGPVGAHMDILVRVGDAWNTQAAAFSGSVTKATGDAEVVFVNMLASNITLSVGQTFVMETQGNDTGAGLLGSYIDPATGPAAYPEPLFLSGGIFVPGWRHGFTTYMLGGAAPCYANCDQSTTAPVLNVLDFNCFLNRFAAGDSFANCDQSTTPPVLNVLDFNCFLNRFAAGCS